MNWCSSLVRIPFLLLNVRIQDVIPNEDMTVNHAIAVSGSLEQWQEQIARKVCGMAPKLSILVGLSSFLLPLLGESGAIFHLCGDSSTGKTAAIRAGASVNGLAAEPGSGSPTQIQRWNSTSNGLELLMVMNNGTTLCTDELGSFTGKFLQRRCMISFQVLRSPEWTARPLEWRGNPHGFKTYCLPVS